MKALTSISILALVLVGSTAYYFQSKELQRTRAELSTLQASPIDIGFSQAMSLHHQQAITMAQLMLDGRPTGLTALAKSIASSQLLELGEMRGWLRLWGQAFLPPSDNMSWMLLSEKPLSEKMNRYLIDCRSSVGGMPGLASQQDMTQLMRLEARERDELFLKLMLAHHEGGTPMAEFASTEASLPVIRKLAGQMLLEQTKEIHQIRSILAAVASP